MYTQCTVQCIDTKEHEITLLFDVMDTGSGFDADGEAVMFKPFSQIDSSVWLKSLHVRVYGVLNY